MSSENTREVRCLMAGVELRAAPAGSKSPGMLVGHAAVFGPLSEDLGGFVERIVPGAFAAVLKSSDVRALVNHDENQRLGRSGAGTLRMIEDPVGLRTEIDLPDTQVGRDTAEDVRNGNLDGMSFSFDTDADEWDYSGETPLRTLRSIRNLYDVGPVTFPAYTDTRVAMRSLDRSRPRPDPTPDPAPTNPPIDLSPLMARLRLAEATTP